MSPHEIKRGDPAWPGALISASDAPESLWVRGALPVGKAAAVVGARAASREGLAAAQIVASGLCQRGFTVVSGGALGIDGAAHRAAVEASGRTIVVLGSGVDVPYPTQHADLFDAVVDGGGAVISQFPLGFEPTRWSFPLRNKVIAGLSEFVIVLDAGAMSGALLTAAAARRYGRTVITLVGTAGCDALAASGALVARSAEEVLARIEGAEVAPPSLPADARALKLYEALDATPRDLGEVAVRAGLRADEVLSLAIELELGGLAARAAGGRYLRLSR